MIKRICDRCGDDLNAKTELGETIEVKETSPPNTLIASFTIRMEPYNSKVHICISCFIVSITDKGKEHIADIAKKLLRPTPPKAVERREGKQPTPPPKRRIVDGK